jgi:hypothetical protein
MLHLHLYRRLHWRFVSFWVLFFFGLLGECRNEKEEGERHEGAGISKRSSSVVT